MSSQPERDYITQGTGRAVARFPPPAQNQRSRLHAWGRRNPAIRRSLCSCGPACQAPIPSDRRPRPRRPLLRDGRARRACGRRRCAAVGRERARPRQGKGGGGASPGLGHRRPGRAAPWPERARVRAHTHPRAAPRGRHCRGPRHHSGAAEARPAPPPPRARPIPPPLHCLASERLAQRKDNGTPGRRGWGAPGLARSLTSRGRRRR